MSKLRKALIVLLIICATFLCGAGLVACNEFRAVKNASDNGKYDKNNPTGGLPFYYPEGADPNDYLDSNNIYTIHTTSLGGLPIDGVKITASRDGVDLKEARSSDGVVIFNLAAGEYDLRYDDLPRGYFTDPESTLFKLTAEEREVTTAFGSAVIDSSAPASTLYNLGDVMYDFRVTNADGDTVILSELLKEKRLVMLNFWYTTCSWCVLEFPHINTAYNAYKNDVAIVALDDQDSPNMVRAFQHDDWPSKHDGEKLNFDMAYDSAGVADRFGINAYPTSIFIDRYGVIAYAHQYFQNLEDLTALFDRFIADDYKQSADMGDLNNGSGEETKATPPPSDIAPMPDDNTMTQAFLDGSMLQGDTMYSQLPLHFRGPDPSIEEEAEDAALSWPFTVGADGAGYYITPSNVGPDTDNTFSILHTDIDLDTDETLTLDIKVNTQESADVLYIYVNRMVTNNIELSGNSGDWQTVTLFSATRYTKVNLIIMYVKSITYTVADEFVGLRNLKISPTYDKDTSVPVDVRTEISKEVDGAMQYAPIYLGDDKFYHVYTVLGEQKANDPLLFVDVLYSTLWSDRHLPGYTITTYDKTSLVSSLYNISYWLFNPKASSDGDNSSNGLLFDGLTPEQTTTVIDSYYIQSGAAGGLVPVSEKVRSALEAFVLQAHNTSAFKGAYVGDHNANTWLELCSYYKTVGGNHNVAGHNCLATTNTGLGKILEYSIPLIEGTNSVTSTDYTMKNRAGGLFYKFTAPTTGVYKLESTNHATELVDPKILIWDKVDADPFKEIPDMPIVELDDSLSVGRLDNNSNDFVVYLYLTAGTTIYPQLTTSAGDGGLYDVVITNIGQSYHALEYATTGEGQWTGRGSEEDWATNLYYISVDTLLDKSVNTQKGGTYFHNADGEGTPGSVIYIDFIHRNFFDENGHSLKEMIDRDYFNIPNKGNYTTNMNDYYLAATSKSEDDPTYGMIEADSQLVQILCMFTSTFDADNDVASGIWKAFACYYRYYGATAWEELE